VVLELLWFQFTAFEVVASLTSRVRDGTGRHIACASMTRFWKDMTVPQPGDDWSLKKKSGP
jgi:hypothetical protein